MIHVEETLRMVFAKYKKENLCDPCYIRKGYLKPHERAYHLTEFKQFSFTNARKRGTKSLTDASIFY